MEKSLKVKVPFINYVDLESLLEKISTCHNNLEKSSTPKIKEHTPQIIHCLYIVHLIQQKIKLIITEAKIVCKTFVWI